MTLSHDLKVRILDAFHQSRGELPPVHDVKARPNVRRVASLSTGRSGETVLNLSTAVVEAGEDAWALVAPALEGKARARKRLLELARPGMVGNRRRRAARKGRGSGRPAGDGDRPVALPAALPDTPCQGTPEQQRFLAELIQCVRETSGHAAALPSDVQVRISRRMTSRLGTCTWLGSSRRLTFAERLFRPGLEEILWETVKHELAHLAHQVTSAHGRTDHGPDWRRWAAALGARPERLCAPDDVRRIDQADGGGRRGPFRRPRAVQRWLARKNEEAPPTTGPTNGRRP